MKEREEFGEAYRWSVKVLLPQTCIIQIPMYNYFNNMILTLRLLMSYIYGAPILDVSRSHTTTQHNKVGLLWTSDQLVAETST